MQSKKTIDCQLAVIGAGMAGIASAAFALHRGIDTVQIGDNAELSFASGCLDLFGANPFEKARRFENPWEGIDTFLNSNPSHPYSNLSKDSITSAFYEFSGFMASVNLPYTNHSNKNQYMITPAGTLKPTYFLPSSMSAGSEAVENQKKILIVDIKGLKGFSSVQMVENLKKSGVQVFGSTISFPGKEDFFELNCERMAWELEMGSAFDAFAEKIKSVKQDADVIGLPAILGIYSSENLRLRLEKEVGIPIFEIPTFSPSVTGLRMKEKMSEGLKSQGLNFFSNTRVKSFEMDDSSRFVFNVTRGVTDYEIRAENVILATGRFFGRGLSSVNGQIHEALFDLFVAQPESRESWYKYDFFNKEGHAINRCGLNTDKFFRPLDEKNNVAYENLYAVGSILADQDWKREKSGAGISIASAYSAVSSISRKLSVGVDDKCTNGLNAENAA